MYFHIMPGRHDIPNTNEQNLKSKQLNLPSTFTMLKNGGIKTVFRYKDNDFALISSSKIGVVTLNSSEVR